jgi:hypothetical protein
MVSNNIPGKMRRLRFIWQAPMLEYCPNGVFAFVNGKAVVANPHKCVSGCTVCEPYATKSHSLPKTPIRHSTNENRRKRLTEKNHMQEVRQSLLDKPRATSTAKVNIRRKRRLKISSTKQTSNLQTFNFNNLTVLTL